MNTAGFGGSGLPRVAAVLFATGLVAYRPGMKSGERRLAAIMFTDIVGYTHLSQANESLALELLEEHQDLLRPEFPAHGEVARSRPSETPSLSSSRALSTPCSARSRSRRRWTSATQDRSLPEARAEDRDPRWGRGARGRATSTGTQSTSPRGSSRSRSPAGVCISQQVFDQIRNKTSLADREDRGREAEERRPPCRGLQGQS